MNPGLGEISLGDYRRIMNGGRWRWGRRATLAGWLILLCFVCTAAGDYWGPWTGKGSKAISLQQAIGILERTSVRQWEVEIGLGSTYQHVERAVEAIRSVAMRGGGESGYASDYLRNISIQGIASLKDLRHHGVDVGRHEANLGFIKAALDKD